MTFSDKIDVNSFEAAFEELFEILNKEGTNKLLRCEYLMYVFEGVLFRLSDYPFNSAFNSVYFLGKIPSELQRVISQFYGLIDSKSELEEYTETLYYFGTTLLKKFFEDHDGKFEPSLGIRTYISGSISTILKDLEAQTGKTGTVAEKNQKIILYRKRQVIKGFVKNFYK